ncbi:MAG: bifunctional riboflavin kinase/FAD synthetase [Burkholderiaceae bacterium]|nr:bifunctional riboflavin kinase/FAD synthetase [Burkholderiaceae bacterium]
MEVFRLLPPADLRTPCALTIGNFDGVHRGHQAVLARLVGRARELDVPGCVLTFEPHPREYFAQVSGGKLIAPPRILTERDKLDALAQYGVQRVCIAHFNATTASLAAESFIDDVIVEGLRAKYLLIGDDFRFGAARRGDFEMLARAAGNKSFELARHETVAENGTRVSSSAVRAALGAGEFGRARTLLGRPYFISGHIVPGRKLGRTLGFPTINIRIPFANPVVHGVFVVRVHGLRDAPIAGVASLGTRPAVERDGKPLLEAHLFDFDADVYGQLARVEFLARLREERHFENLTALTAQIAQDARDARAHFAATDEAH